MDLAGEEKLRLMLLHRLDLDMMPDWDLLDNRLYPWGRLVDRLPLAGACLDDGDVEKEEDEEENRGEAPQEHLGLSKVVVREPDGWAH